LVGERHRIRTVDRELALADHVHEFDAGEHAAGAAERFEVKHRPIWTPLAAKAEKGSFAASALTASKMS
jgi:hypothetical protein